MKKFNLIALMLTLSCLSLNAQIKNTPKTIIAATNMNILYKGIDNPISIAVDGISDEYIVAEVSNGNGKIRKVGKGEYIVNVDYGTYEFTIAMDCMDKDGTIFQKDTTITGDNNSIDVVLYTKFDREKVYLDSKSFRAIDLKKPKVEIGNLDGGLIKKEILLKKPYLKINVDDIYSQIDYKVTEFMMTFNNGRKAEAPCFTSGNRFTPEMISKIKELKKGDKIYIEGIRVSVNGVVTSVENPQMIFTIK